MPVSETITILGIFTSFAFIIYTYLDYRHKERMALIDTGQSANLFSKQETIRHHSALKWGLIFLSLGIAAAIGINLDIFYDNDGPIITFPSLAIGAGVGFLSYFMIARNMRGGE